MQQLQPGILLQGGKYKIERVLGQGGFGITYLAEQVMLQRKVSIKEFFMKRFCTRDASGLVETPSMADRSNVMLYRKKFIKEARNLARLCHTNIIEVMDIFVENETAYYVMPYLSGGSIQDYVKTHGPLTEDQAMECVRSIASALKYMHEEEHICHFDVKPANILFDDNRYVLIDFGISKNYDAYGQETSATPIGLSQGYAPVEQYKMDLKEFSPTCDVYGLGATLYFLLHGKRPVSSVERAGGTPLYMRSSLSPYVKDIINSSMKISKTERAQSVDVFWWEDEGSLPSQTKTNFLRILCLAVIEYSILVIYDKYIYPYIDRLSLPSWIPNVCSWAIPVLLIAIILWLYMKFYKDL